METENKAFNLLFVCRHNKFRSKFAEVYFNKINKNPNIKVRSAGIFPGQNPLSPREGEVLKKLKIKFGGKPKPVTTDLLMWNDLIVLITDDVPNPKKLFNYANYKNEVIVWKIKDTNGKKIGELLKKIIRKVNQLNKKLKKI